MLTFSLCRSATSRRIVPTLGTVLLFLALSAASIRAGQSGPAPLSGTIYDATGGVIPGVEVALVDSNQTRRVATSAATGRFEFSAVAPGKYVLEARLPGFRTLRHEVDLRSAADWNRAVTLQVGELQETITISASRLAAPPAAQRETGPAAPVRVGGDVRAPRKEVDAKPVYPAAMREAGLSGVVPIEAIIGPDGTVSSVRVLSAQVHPDFAIAAVNAVRKWRYSPTLLNGVPVEVVMTVSVRFDLAR